MEPSGVRGLAPGMRSQAAPAAERLQWSRKNSEPGIASAWFPSSIVRRTPSSTSVCGPQRTIPSRTAISGRIHLAQRTDSIEAPEGTLLLLRAESGEEGGRLKPAYCSQRCRLHQESWFPLFPVQGGQFPRLPVFKTRAKHRHSMQDSSSRH